MDLRETYVDTKTARPIYHNIMREMLINLILAPIRTSIGKETHYNCVC